MLQTPLNLLPKFEGTVHCIHELMTDHNAYDKTYEWKHSFHYIVVKKKSCCRSLSMKCESLNWFQNTDQPDQLYP